MILHTHISSGLLLILSRNIELWPELRAHHIRITFKSSPPPWSFLPMIAISNLVTTKSPRPRVSTTLAVKLRLFGGILRLKNYIVLMGCKAFWPKIFKIAGVGNLQLSIFKIHFNPTNYAARW